MTSENIFWKLLANESLVMTCLQIYRELLSLATFLWVHSNSEEVSYLSWQNTYLNLKTTCHIKLKFFCWTKNPGELLEWDPCQISHTCHWAFEAALPPPNFRGLKKWLKHTLRERCPNTEFYLVRVFRHSD